MHETKKLEFKETITNTFLKTVRFFQTVMDERFFRDRHDNGNVGRCPMGANPFGYRK